VNNQLTQFGTQLNEIDDTVDKKWSSQSEDLEAVKQMVNEEMKDMRAANT
jgi:predicted sugar kinase